MFNEGGGEAEVTNTFNDLSRPKSWHPPRAGGRGHVWDGAAAAVTDEDAPVAWQIYVRALDTEKAVS